MADWGDGVACAGVVVDVSDVMVRCAGRAARQRRDTARVIRAIEQRRGISLNVDPDSGVGRIVLSDAGVRRAARAFSAYQTKGAVQQMCAAVRAVVGDAGEEGVLDKSALDSVLRCSGAM